MSGKLFKGVVEVQQFPGRAVGRESRQVWKLPTVSAAFLSAFSASVFDEDSSHSTSGCSEEVPATGKSDLGGPGHPQVGFVNQGSSIQRMARTLLVHLCAGQSPQLIVHEWP